MNAPAMIPFHEHLGRAEPSSKGLGANLRYALAVLRRHWLLAAGVLGAALSLAFAATLLTMPRYTAEASIQINDQRDKVLGDEMEADFEATSDWDTERFLNTQLDILRSRQLAERVVNALNLPANPAFWRAMEVETPPNAPAAARELALQLVQGNMSVELPRSSRIARIGFASTDREVSARVANALAEEFIRANLQRRFDSSAYARDFVAGQLEEARIALEASERELNDYARTTGLIRTGGTLAPGNPQASASGGGSTITASSLLQLNDAAIGARATRIAAQAEWDAIRSAPLLSTQAELNNPTVQALMTRRAAVETELLSARQRYLPDHPSIGRLQGDLAAVQAQLGSAAQNVRRSIRAQFDAAVSAEGQLDAQVGRLRGETLAEQDRSVRYNVLARQADTARSIFDGLLQRFRELNAAAGISSSNIAIIDRAMPPAAPSSPNLPRNLALALFAGLLAAVGLVFLRDQFDDVLHVPEDVEAKLALPLLGIVPRAAGGSPLAELAEPKSVVAEAYNSMRGSLLYSTAKGLPKLIAFTSAGPGEGKSTTSFAAAAGFARLGLKVLLIDADLRRPSIHRLTGVPGVRGLTDLIVSRDPAGSAIVRSETEAFDVLPSGPLPPSPSELIGSPRMAQLLEEVAALYDVVLIDSPPVLGLADAPMLAAICDGTVFVVEAERGGTGQLKSALRRLRGVQPVLVGAVLTKFDPKKAANR
jgi:capsular exopolysaccharide synthesis family protein